MWMIRAAQLRAFEAVAVRRDTAQLVDAVRAAWPVTVERLGNEEVSSRVGRAIKRAAFHGITSLGAVAIFVHIDFALGENFDCAFAFAATILARNATESEKMDALVAGSVETLIAHRK
jgi:hypothetical protein